MASLFETITLAGGHHGPILLPGLGKWAFLGLPQFGLANFRVVSCEACGLTRFNADADARAKLPTAQQWRRI